jgi:predicted transcriptional regulator
MTLIDKRASGINLQIKKMYEEDGYTVEQIAESLELDVAAVTMALSSVMAKKTVEEKSAYSEIQRKMIDIKDEAIATIHELTSIAESESVRADCAKFILETAMGNKHPRTRIPTEFSAVQFNVILQQAGEAYKKQREGKKEIVDV